MHRFFIATMSFFVFISSLHAECLTVRSRTAGMFSIFQDVVYYLHAYDEGVIDGLEINFDKTGLYYDSRKGPNWWNYYFLPIYLGSDENNRITAVHNEFNRWYTPEQNNEMILKYIRIRPEIEKDVSNFVRENFTNRTIGVHYRGTDKWCESPRVAYEKVIRAVAQVILCKNSEPNYKIFVATDEQAFLDEMIDIFGDKVCYITAARTEKDYPALHLDPERDAYQQGYEALMDCLLLSQTHFMVRTASNLNTCVLYFNPKLANIMIN